MFDTSITKARSHFGGAGNSCREAEPRKSNRTWVPAFAGTTFLAMAVVLVLPLALAAEAPKWRDDWQKTIEAAKKEAQLSLYGGQEITHPEILAAFN